MGDLSQLLGMHITCDRSARTISVDQSKYMRDILAKYGMTASKPSFLPMRDILAKYGMTASKPSFLPMDPGFFADLVHMAPPLVRGGKGRLPQPHG
jgi:predicted naringenin-chalcone synthase